MLKENDIQAFIFNWKGNFRRASNLEISCNKILNKVSVINAQKYRTRDGWIKIPDTNFFCGKFKKALELFSSEIFFHIQADVEIDDLDIFIQRALTSFNETNTGVYAPYVFWTTWRPKKADFPNQEAKSLERKIKEVICTDESVWMINKKIINEFKKLNLKMDNESLGWGIDVIISAISFHLGLKVLRDYKFKYKHPPSTAYNARDAMRDMEKLFDQLPLELKKTCWDIWDSRGNKKKLKEVQTKT